MLQDAIGRPVGLASYMLEKKCTIRECAKHFGISKSTVHLDVSVRLRKINKDLYSQVKELLEYHREVRHLRGGMATKEKYKSKKLYQKLPC